MLYAIDILHGTIKQFCSYVIHMTLQTLNREMLKNVYQPTDVSFQLGNQHEDFLSIVFHGCVFPCPFPPVLCHLFLYFPIIFFITFFHAFQTSSLIKIIEDVVMQFTGLRLEHGVLFLAQSQTYRQNFFLLFSACFHKYCTELLCSPGDQKRGINKCSTAFPN